MYSVKHRILKSLVYLFIFLGLPLASGLYFLLDWAHQHFVFLGDGFAVQYVLLCTGCLIGMIMYYTRIRWLLVVIIFYIIISIILSFIDRFISAGEINYFFAVHRFTLNLTLLVIGSVVSYGIINSRLSAMLTCITIVVITLYLITHSGSLQSGWSIISIFIFIAIFCSTIVYGIFVQKTHFEIYSQTGSSFRSKIGKSIIAIGILAIISIIHVYVFREKINDTWDKLTREFEVSDSENMVQREKEGVRLNEETQLSGQNGRMNELLAVAYIDNFFEGTEVPNPLYLTSFYYSYFDSATEVFKATNDMPDKDLFKPDPTSIPLYYSVTDSTVLAFSKNNLRQKTVDIEVYNKGLTPDQFFAPTTAYSIQPIAIDKNFQHEYKNAYKAKSMVSELNSAYFIYNSDEPAVRSFQENRYNILRTITHFNDMPQDAYTYYTHIPSISYLNEIKDLAIEITRDKSLPIDKIIAVKDYFLAKDELGKPIYKYSDNPGIPDLPSASKLHHFLFEGKKGYCAYYAGATVFMLRALGIPTRVNVGFLTEDRSTANKGWYYFYADQLHAWVQVYFPGYGWIDFDTTVGNDEARESPQPDGTPPSSPPKAAFSAAGIIQHVDTSAHSISIEISQYLLDDQRVVLGQTDLLTVSSLKADIISNSQMVKIQDLKAGDTASVVVFNTHLTEGISTDNIMESLIAAEQIIIKPYNSANTSQHSEQTKDKTPLFSPVLAGLLLVGLVFFLALLFPQWLLAFYMRRSHSPDKKRQYQHAYLAVNYYVSQFLPDDYMHMKPGLELYKKVDAAYGTQLVPFLHRYHYIKYSDAKDLRDIEPANVTSDIQKMKNLNATQQPTIKRVLNTINIFKTLKFLTH